MPSECRDGDSVPIVWTRIMRGFQYQGQYASDPCEGCGAQRGEIAWVMTGSMGGSTIGRALIICARCHAQTTPEQRDQMFLMNPPYFSDREHILEAVDAL